MAVVWGLSVMIISRSRRAFSSGTGCVLTGRVGRMAYEDQHGYDQGDGLLVENDGCSFVEQTKRYRMMRRMPATEHYCELCDKTFRHPSKIAEHMRTHNGERPFLCEICGARFTQGHPLKVHMGRHVGELPFKCSFCEKSFRTKESRIRHERIHTVGETTPSTDDYVTRRWQQEESEEDFVRVVGRRGTGKGKRGRQQREEAADRHEEEQCIAEEECYLYECPVGYCNVRSLIREEVEQHINTAHAHLWDGGDEEVVEEEEPEEGVHSEAVEGAEGDAVPPSSTLLHPSAPQAVSRPESVDVVGCSDDYDYSSQYSEVVEYPCYEYVQDEQVHVVSEGDGADEAGPKTLTSLRGGKHTSARSSALRKSRKAEHSEAVKDETLEGFQQIFYEGSPRMNSAPPAYEVEVMTTGEDGGGCMEEGELIQQTHLPVEMTAEDDVLLQEEERVRLLANPQPPRKGRQWRANEELLEEVEVAAAVLEDIMPQNRQQSRHSRRRLKNAGPCNSRNLDWIIDAVAAGVDVDLASPHNRKKPVVYDCEFCGQIIKYPSKIAAHLRIHTGEKPYKCEICGQGFAQKTPMRMHMRRHLGERRYRCGIEDCPAAFVSQSLLNAHQSSRHFGRKFICMRGCGRLFASARNQRVHESNGRCLGTRLRRGEGESSRGGRGRHAARDNAVYDSSNYARDTRYQETDLNYDNGEYVDGIPEEEDEGIHSIHELQCKIDEEVEEDEDIVVMDHRLAHPEEVVVSTDPAYL